MSETRFTPGPWEVAVEDDFDCGDNILVRMGEAIESPCNHEAHLEVTVFEDADPDIPDQYTEALANAHLIAAAPDLYAALDALCGLATHRGGHLHEYAEAVAAARAALAKAEGRA